MEYLLSFTVKMICCSYSGDHASTLAIFSSFVALTVLKEIEKPYFKPSYCISGVFRRRAFDLKSNFSMDC